MIEQEFPHNNWYIEITDENRKIINDWKVNQSFSDDLFINPQYKYINYLGEREGWVGCGGGVELITTEEFIKYVLKQSIQEQSCDYLTPLLKKLNII